MNEPITLLCAKCSQQAEAHQSCKWCGKMVHDGDGVIVVADTVLFYEEPNQRSGSYGDLNAGDDCYCSAECLAWDWAYCVLPWRSSEKGAA